MTPDDLRDAGAATRRVAAYVVGVLAAEAAAGTPVDRPSHVVGLGATRDVPASLRTRPGATAFATRPTAGVDAPAGLAVPITTRHAPALELLAGRRLVDGLDGVVVLTTSRLPLGGGDVRVALGVARDGDEVQGLLPADGDRPVVERVAAARALRPSDPAHDGAVLPGVLVAAARRYLGLPTAPPSPAPWRLLTDAWASTALTAAETARRRAADLERWARGAVALRPDVGLVTQRRTRDHLGADATAVALRDAYAEPDTALAARLPAPALQAATDPATVLAATTREAAGVAEHPDALWDAACVLFPAPGPDERAAAPEWYDAPALVRHVAAALGTRPGATDQLVASPDLPGWFTRSTRAWLDALP